MRMTTCRRCGVTYTELLGIERCPHPEVDNPDRHKIVEEYDAASKGLVPVTWGFDETRPIGSVSFDHIGMDMIRRHYDSSKRSPIVVSWLMQSVHNALVLREMSLSPLPALQKDPEPDGYVIDYEIRTVHGDLKKSTTGLMIKGAANIFLEHVKADKAFEKYEVFEVRYNKIEEGRK